MTDLVACLSSGKGSWASIKELIEKVEWGNIYLVTDDFGVQRFNSGKKINFVITDSRKPISEVKEDIKRQLNGKIGNTEVALNLVSGTGKEHTAVISALLQIGLGIRFVELENGELKEV